MAPAYVYPKFGTRDLGEALFPYARALVLAQRRRLVLINPDWPGLGMFRSGGVAGPRKTLLLLTRPKVAEADLEKEGPGGAVVVTTGPGNYFKDIAAERDHIANAMSRILRRRDAQRIRAQGPYGIGLYAPGLSAEWCLRTIEKIRADVGKESPVEVVGAVANEDLKSVLQMPGVRRLALGPAADLFALSSCKAVLAAGTTFAAWAAFLGHVPVVWERRAPELEGLFMDGTFEGILPADAELPLDLAAYLRQRLAVS